MGAGDSAMSSDYYGGLAGEIADAGACEQEGDWDGVCEHDCAGAGCDEDACTHSHCFACGECGCAGYCDDYQTYNLRPAETGGSAQPPA